MRISLLEAQPALARQLTPDELATAQSALTVATMTIPAGEWQAPREPRERHLGLLMLDGLILRETCISRDWSTEILSTGDILRPWLEDSASFVAARWHALEPTEMAILDPAAAVEIGRYPGLLDELIDRAIRRSRSMAVHAVIEGVHRIDERLLLLFWHLAEKHGTRVNGQVEIPLRLTHSHLSRLVGARRPTVTTALGALAERGQVMRLANGSWAVAGPPPQPEAMGD